MSARNDFLTYLAAQGFTPNRAVLCEEGSGDPLEFYTSEILSKDASTPTWIADATYGNAIKFDQTSDYYYLTDSSFCLGNKGTIILVIRHVDTTARASSPFSTQQASNATRFSAHLPYSDGNIYFDFGGITGNNRVSVAYTKTTTHTAFVFRSGTTGGTAGLNVFKNGTSIVSNSTAVTRTTSSDHYNFNIFFGGAGDINEMYIWIHIPDAISDVVAANCTVANILGGMGQAEQTVLANENLNNLAESVSLIGEGSLSFAETINNLLDDLSNLNFALTNLLLELSENANNWLDSIIDPQIAIDSGSLSNPYGIPDQEYYMRRYINDLPKPYLTYSLSDINGLTENLNNWLDEIILALSGHGCPCVVDDYIPAAGVTDDFERSDGPDFQSSAWTSITYDPFFEPPSPVGPNNEWPSISTIRIKNGMLENHRPKNEVGRINDGSISIGGFRNDIGPAANWLVEAVWGNDATPDNISPPIWYLMAPISFNAGPPYNSLMVSGFAFYAVKDGSGYRFGLLSMAADGTGTYLNPTVTKTTAEWGPGHIYALKVTCNEMNCVKIQGIIDGVVEIEKSAAAGSIASKPSGYAGVGLDNDYARQVATVASTYLDSYAALASWSANILV